MPNLLQILYGSKNVATPNPHPLTPRTPSGPTYLSEGNPGVLQANALRSSDWLSKLEHLTNIALGLGLASPTRGAALPNANPFNLPPVRPTDFFYEGPNTPALPPSRQALPPNTPEAALIRHTPTLTWNRDAFLELMQKTTAAERNPHQRMSPEDGVLWDSGRNWEAFSRKQGYTEAEINDYRRMLDLWEAGKQANFNGEHPPYDPDEKPSYWKPSAQPPMPWDQSGQPDIGGIPDVLAHRAQLAALSARLEDQASQTPLLDALQATVRGAAPLRPLTYAPPPDEPLHTAVSDPRPGYTPTFGGLPTYGPPPSPLEQARFEADAALLTPPGASRIEPPDYPPPLSYNQRRRRANAALPSTSQRPVSPPPPPPSLAAPPSPNTRTLPYAGPTPTDMPLPTHPDLQAYLQAHPENLPHVQQLWNAIMGVPNPNFHGLDAPTDLPHSSRLPGMRTVSELPPSILDPYDLREEPLPPMPWDSETQNLWSAPPSAWIKHPDLPAEPAPGQQRHSPWSLNPSEVRLGPTAPPDTRSPHRAAGTGLDFPTSLENSLFSMNSLFPEYRDRSGKRRMTADAFAAAYPVPWVDTKAGTRVNPNTRPPVSHTDYTEGPLLPNQVQTIRTNPSNPADISPAVHTLKSQKLSDDTRLLSIEHPAVRGHNLAPFNDNIKREHAAQLKAWAAARTTPPPPALAKILRSPGNFTYRQLYDALQSAKPGTGPRTFRALGYTGAYYQDLPKGRDKYQYQPPTGRTVARLWSAPSPKPGLSAKLTGMATPPGGRPGDKDIGGAVPRRYYRPSTDAEVHQNVRDLSIALSIGRRFVPSFIKDSLVPPHVRGVLHYLGGSGASTSLGLTPDHLTYAYPYTTPNLAAELNASRRLVAHPGLEDIRRGALIPIEMGNDIGPPDARALQATLTLGKAFYSPERGEILDDYRFYPPPPHSTAGTIAGNYIADFAPSLKRGKLPSPGFYLDALLAQHGRPFPVRVPAPPAAAEDLSKGETLARALKRLLEARRYEQKARTSYDPDTHSLSNFEQEPFVNWDYPE